MLNRTSAALIAALAASAAALPARAAPAEVIIIRHGEKPATGNDLSPLGYLRANALVGFFQTNPAVTKFGAPAAIYAMGPDSPKGSLRPIQTVAPLAKALGLPIHREYTKDQLPQLVSAVRSNSACDGKTVLICWEHKVIPALVHDFGLDSPETQDWHGSVFDQAWVLEMKGEKAVSAKIVPEHVLPGDSVK